MNQSWQILTISQYVSCDDVVKILKILPGAYTNLGFLNALTRLSEADGVFFDFFIISRY